MSLGPLLQGWSPPFTPTGNAAYWRLAGPGFSGVRPVHNGLLVRFEADAERVAEVLPAPLRPTGETGKIAVFVNQTILMPVGLEDPASLESSSTRFHEAIVMFPCRLGDQDYTFHYIMYTDSGWCVYCGVVAGLTTKLADIDLLVPLPPHPSWAVGRAGSSLRASVSREGERLLAARCRVGAEVDAARVFEFAPDIVGMRYFPDVTNRAEQRPLVHDIVVYDLADVEPGRAWTGDATIDVYDTMADELGRFQPTRVLEARYLEGFSYRNLGARVIYDYTRAGR